jgi:hypothetical protein
VAVGLGAVSLVLGLADLFSILAFRLALVLVIAQNLWIMAAAAAIAARRLAALDMYGTTGSARRRRLIRAEFIIGAAGCTLLGVLALMSGTGWAIVLGIWLVATGMNYLPLAISAPSLSRLGRLRKSSQAPICRASCGKLVRTNAGSLFASRSDRRSSAGLEPPAPAPRASRRFTGRTSSGQVAAELDSYPGSLQKPCEGRCEAPVQHSRSWPGASK